MLQKNSLVKTKRAVRKAIEGTYNGVCSVWEYRGEVHPKTKVTRQKEVLILENHPCRISFESVTAAVQSETAATAPQGVKLFIAPEIKLSPGSKIVVEQNGVKAEYSASGKPAVYHSHQEISLELWKGWI